MTTAANSPKSALPPTSPSGIGGRFGDGLAVWADWVRRLAWPIVIAAVLLTIFCGYYTIHNLRMHTGRDSLLAADLPFEQTYREYQAAFPNLEAPLVVVIDATTSEQADRAATTLAERMRQDREHFRSVFYPEGDPFFKRNGLLFLEPSALERLSNQLAGAQPLLAALAGDPSLRGLLGVLGLAAEAVTNGQAEAATVAPLFAAVATAVETVRREPTTALSWRALIAGENKPEANRRVLVAMPAYDFSSLQPAAGALAAVRAAAQEFHLDGAHGVRVRLTGDAAIDEDELKSVEEGIGWAAAISFVLVSIVSYVGLRSPKILAATLITLSMSLVWTAAFAALAVGHLNLISVAFSVLFIGLAVDFSIQLAMRHKEELDGGHSHAEALRQAARGSGPPVILAAIAASIGFFAFVPTDYTGLAELGVIAGTGMLIGLSATLTLLPALLCVLRPRPAAGRQAYLTGETAGLWLVRHPRVVTLTALALGLAALLTLPHVRFDIDPINLKDPDTESVRTYWDLATSNESSPYTIGILAPDLDTATALAQRLRQLPEVKSAVTVRDFVPADQDMKLATIDQMALFLSPLLTETTPSSSPDPDQQRQAVEAFRHRLRALLDSGRADVLTEPAKRLYEALAPYAASGSDERITALDRALLAYLPQQLNDLRLALTATPVTLDDLPADLRRRYLAEDGRARVEVHAREPLTNVDNLERFVTAVRGVAPNATDISVLLLEAGRTMVGALEQAAFYALVLITLLLLIVLRSVRDTVLVLLPLLLASLLTTASGVLLGIPFNFANIIAVPLLFSLGVAFGIYLVMRDRETHSVAQLMRTSTPRAVVFSALTTMVSFGSLMISSHRGTSSMGSLLTIALTFAVACTVIVLPALLVWRDQGWRRTSA